MKVWDRKYDCWMFAAFKGIEGDASDCFVAKGGRGYSHAQLIANEDLEKDAYLPEEAEKTGKRFIIVSDTMCLVRCPSPTCKHVFDSAETFSWKLDFDGHPTVEHLYCPKCWAGTNMMHENWTPDDPEYDYNDFKDIA
jgi:hypothetical protein